jgi:hypothetical protein
MANFTEKDIQQALAGGLISEADAAFLGQSLQSQGSALGAAGGALAGAGLGAGVGKLTGIGARALAGSGRGGEMVQKGAAAFNQKMPDEMFGRQMPEWAAGQSRGEMGAMAGLGAVGSIGGGMAGNAMMGEGQMDEETSAAIQMLMDPAVGKKEKQQIMQFLQAKEQGMSGEQGGQGGQEQGMDWGQMAAMTGGGLLGGAAMGQAGKWASRALGDGLGPVARGAQAMDTRRMLPEGMQNRMFDSVHPGEMAGTALGLGSGAAAGNTLMNQYEDPLQ